MLIYSVLCINNTWLCLDSFTDRLFGLWRHLVVFLYKCELNSASLVVKSGQLYVNKKLENILYMFMYIYEL